MTVKSAASRAHTLTGIQMYATKVLDRMATGAAAGLLAFPFVAFFGAAFVLLGVVVGCLLG